MILSFRAGVAAGLIVALGLTGAEAGKKKVSVPAPEPAPAAKLLPAVPLRALKSVWTQYGPGGVLEARAVVEGQCPAILTGVELGAMQPRASADANFPTLCSATLPATTKLAALVFPKELAGTPPAGALPVSDVVPLPVPVADPQRILIIGDGGCRSKAEKHQDCLKPEIWPFAQVSAEAAKLKPDLVIHVGDYVSREQACPANVAVCQNQPFGDNWAAWDADTFTPLKPLLAVAPVVFTRGNHEDCKREGLGYLRLLAPQAFDPKAGCIPHLPPYSVPFARLNLVVSDDADAEDTSVVDAEVPVYRAEIANLANEKSPTWWVLHRPIWGLISGPLGIPAGGNQTILAAVEDKGIPAPVELMLSGHIHTFEAINYTPDPHVPPQILSGRGGDLMDPTPANLRGAIFQGLSGVHVKDGISVPEFGFSLMTRTDDGWRIDVYDWHGTIQRVCQFHNSRIDCPVAKR